ncbi:hypothetical protein Acsp04_27140 [Actinomadura sp. NBRC 104425]|nr:hypothetical protein Acsp04_27140 [Actinomadura sp. NBRC 104425]
MRRRRQIPPAPDITTRPAPGVVVQGSPTRLARLPGNLNGRGPAHVVPQQEYSLSSGVSPVRE